MAEAASKRRGRPPAMSAEAKRAASLEAAVVVFGERGRAEATLDEIAGRVGVSKAALYELFESKDALYEAAAEVETARLADHLMAALADSLDAPFGTRTRLRLRALFGYADERPAGYRFLLRLRTDRPGRVPEVTEATRRTTSGAVTATIRTEFERLGYPTVFAPEVVAALVGGMTESLLVLAAEHPDVDRDQLVDLLATFTVAGLVGTDRALLDALDHEPPTR